MTEAAAERKIRVPLIVAAGSRFGRYKPEEEKEVCKVEVKEDKVLKQLKAAWKGYDHDPCSGGRIVEDASGELYNRALARIKGLDYSAKDVENFSIALAEFQDEKGFSDNAGVFLSALINNGRDTDYVIHTRHLSPGIQALGCENTKNITVDGDVEARVGLHMKGGSITVNGTVIWGVGYVMQGGSITVNGDAGDWVGNSMEGGSITVNGDARYGVGNTMKGGEIHLEGDYHDVSQTIKGGKVYHKGVLIVDKGFS